MILRGRGRSAVADAPSAPCEFRVSRSRRASRNEVPQVERKRAPRGGRSRGASGLLERRGPPGSDTPRGQPWSLPPDARGSSPKIPAGAGRGAPVAAEFPPPLGKTIRVGGGPPNKLRSWPLNIRHNEQQNTVPDGRNGQSSTPIRDHGCAVVLKNTGANAINKSQPTVKLWVLGSPSLSFRRLDPKSPFHST